MKRTILFSLLFLSASAAIADDTYYRGYQKSDGTYVQPHHQTAPNNPVYDNYSTKGNVNLYTGKAGTVTPDTASYQPAPTYSPYRTKW